MKKYTYIRQVPNAWDFLEENIYEILDEIEKRSQVMYTGLFYETWESFNHNTKIEIGDEITYGDMWDREKLEEIIKKHTRKRNLPELIAYFLEDYTCFKWEGYARKGEGLVFEEIDLDDFYNEIEWGAKKAIERDYRIFGLTEKDVEWIQKNEDRVKEIIYDTIRDLQNRIEVYETDTAIGYSQGDKEGLTIIYIPKKGKEKEIKELLDILNQNIKRLFTYQEFEKVEVEVQDDIDEDKIEEYVREIGQEKIYEGEGDIITEDDIYDYKDEDNTIIDYAY